jgi:murein DD-endopeptidase MepM/ murein hydrolase activator NlpD
MRYLFLSNCLLWSIVLFISCKSQKGLAGRSAHAQYAEKLTDAGLDKTSMGSLWLAAANKSLQQPASISLPYKETGYFPSDKPMAAGYSFAVKQGEKIIASITKVSSNRTLLFAELWQLNESGGPGLVAIADTINNRLEYEAEKEGRLLLRMQPELLNSVEYTIIINTTPSLAFPVPSSANPQVSSLWGADRDGGARRHEGIDIFAKKRTPAVASADGRVTRVEENNLGGKVVFLRPEGKDYNLYYAHLDTQSVSAGQQVRAGDVVGLIGNTGNARTTPAHLHFGIYTRSGAVDPFPFVNNKRPQPGAVIASTDVLNRWMRSRGNATVYSTPSAKGAALVNITSNQALTAVAATGTFYKVILPGAQEGFIANEQVTATPLPEQKLNSVVKLLDAPNSAAPAKTIIPAGEKVAVLGEHAQFRLVRFKEMEGWITK